MTKTVIYARYSSDNQRDESIDAQVRACRAYAAQHDMEILHIYADRALSGTTDNRPEFQAMIRAAKKGGGFEAVLVHKLDRFSRDRLEALLYKRELLVAGVRLESTVERLGDDPESALMESIYFGMAEFYSRNLAREVRKGLQENALKGLHCGGVPPFGYVLNRNTMKLEIEPTEAAAVRTAFEMYLDGHSYGDISQRLNETGLRGRTGKPFSRGTLNGMFNNEKYCGRWYYGKIAPKDARGKRNPSRHNETYTVIEGGCPAIVPPSTFDAVQERLRARKRGRRCDARVDWLLTGVVRCGCCGELMHTQPRSAHGVKYYYYQCKTKGCPTRSIPKELLEGEVLRQLDAAISAQSRRALAAQLIASMGAGEDPEAIRRKIQGVDTKLANLSRALADGAPWAALADQWEALSQQRASLEAEQLERAGSGSYTLEDAEAFFARFGALSTLPPPQQAEILRRNVRRITVSRTEGDPDGWKMVLAVFPPDAPQPESCGECVDAGSGVSIHTPQIQFVCGCLLLVSIIRR